MSAEIVLPTQIAFLLNLSSAYPSLLEVIPVLDLSKLVTLILDRPGQTEVSHSHKQVRAAALTAWRGAVTR